MRKFIVLSIVLLIIAGFVITSSADEITLWAGQNIDVGTLTVEVIGDNLVVTYNITYPWVLGDTHLYIGTSKPVKNAPGLFPHGPDDAVGGAYIIPLSELPEPDEDGNIVIAAQAEVRIVDPNTGEPIEEETVWAEGYEIRPGKNWAMYFKFELTSPSIIS